MIAKLLSFLAWAGLYQIPMLVLNDGIPPPTNLTVTATQSVDIAANFMDKLIEGYVSEDGKKVSYLALEESPFYKVRFQEFRSFLKVVDPSQMDEQQRKSFFINLYNILTIDAILRMFTLPRSTISITNFWSRYAYQVGRYTLHLDDMEHGVLRGNRPHPSTSTIMFGANDPRLHLTVQPDHRIHSALNCGAASCPALSSFPAHRLDRKLDSSMKDFCNKGVTNVDGSALVINSIFDWFSSDFAPTERLTLKFLSECVEGRDKRRALKEAAEGSRRYTFYYDWALNAM